MNGAYSAPSVRAIRSLYVTVNVSPVNGSVMVAGCPRSRSPRAANRPLESPARGAVGTGRIAQPEELVEGALRPVGAAEAGADRRGLGILVVPGGPGDRVENAVDDEGADPRGEQVGVVLAEDRAVGEAEVVDLLVAERAAQQVHVAGRVGTGHVVEDGAAVTGACGGQRVVGRPKDPLLGRGVRERERRQDRDRLVEGVEAAQRRAEVDPAGVEPDDVEPGPQLQGQHLGHGADELHAGAARAARIEHQRADALTGVSSRQPDHRDADLLALRVAVVQGDRHRRHIGSRPGIPTQGGTAAAAALFADGVAWAGGASRVTLSAAATMVASALRKRPRDIAGWIMRTPAVFWCRRTHSVA